MSISWHSLHGLEESYGDAFYLLDLDLFESNYQEFLGAFKSIYPKSNIAVLV